MNILLWVILAIGIIFIIYIYFKFFKRIKLRNICFIDGTLGSGKTALSVNIAIRQYKHNVRMVKISNKILFWKEEQPMPQLYSNIPLKNIEYVQLTKELITRQKRFEYKSVVLWDEISLSISQMDYQDKIINERLVEFFKLFRHETKGGYLICNSQSINDIHFALRYTLTDYIYIHRKIGNKYFPPLINIFMLEERTYNADNSSLTIKNEDIEKSMKIYISGKRFFKKYDTYNHSTYTDKLQVENKTLLLEDKKDLKSKYIVSYKDLLFIYDHYTEEEIKKLPKTIQEHIKDIKLNTKYIEIKQNQEKYKKKKEVENAKY